MYISGFLVLLCAISTEGGIMGKMHIKAGADIRTNEGISRDTLHRFNEKKNVQIRERDVTIAGLKAMLYEYGELAKKWAADADDLEYKFTKERKKVIILSAILIAACIGSLVGVILNG